jgi:hypothetical protein
MAAKVTAAKQVKTKNWLRLMYNGWLAKVNRPFLFSYIKQSAQMLVVFAGKYALVKQRMGV